MALVFDIAADCSDVRFVRWAKSDRDPFQAVESPSSECSMRLLPVTLSTTLLRSV